MGGVYRVNGDLAVSRGFGDAEYKKTGGPGPEDRPVTADPEMGHFECAASDFLLIVCDGVSEGNFSNAEVCEHAAKVLKETGGDAAKAAEAVVFRALEAESKVRLRLRLRLRLRSRFGLGAPNPNPNPNPILNPHPHPHPNQGQHLVHDRAPRRREPAARVPEGVPPGLPHRRGRRQLPQGRHPAPNPNLNPNP